MNAIRMKTLLNALEGLQAASKALQSLPYGTPQREAFIQVREAEIHLRVDLGMLPPVKIEGASE